MNTESRVINLLQVELQETTLNNESSIENTIGWDSQFQLVVILIIEDEFNIMIPNARLNELTSIQNIVKLIETLG